MKKVKNQQHRLAVRRQADAMQEMQKIGVPINDKRQKIGIIFDHLGASQCAYFGITNINNICRTYAGIDIVIFTPHVIPPCVKPSCPVLNLSFLVSWDGSPLITTCPFTTTIGLSTRCNNLYYYVFSVDHVNIYNDYENLKSTITNPRVKTLVQCPDHKSLLEQEFDISVYDTIVPDFDLEKLVRIVMEDTNAGHSTI